MRWILILLLLGLPLQAGDDKAASLAEIVELLESGDPDKRQQGLARLRSITPAKSDTEIRISFLDYLGVDPLGTEVMSGSQSTNGKRTDYTLRSLGKGRYKLDASVTNANGEKSVVKDEGTLAELGKKYEFLKEVGTVRLPARNYQVPASTSSIRELGIKVKRPGQDLSWHFYVPPGVGFVVTEVDPLSLGHKLGLKPHDLLLKIDGRPIESREQLAAVARGRGKLEGIRRAKPFGIDFPAGG